MDSIRLEEQRAEQNAEQKTAPALISHYSLDFLRRGEHNFYIWRHRHCNETHQHALLIDLNDICIPGNEVDKLVISFESLGSRVLSIAFAHCHIQNQRDIKRKLKAQNIRLFSNTAFFVDLAEAQQWLAARCAVN